MKLFSPTEIKKKKDEIRFHEATVGLNLAKKVDELRRKSSLEELKVKESSLKLEQDFLARFHVLETQEKGLKNEVEELKKQRKKLLEPIEDIERKTEQKKEQAEKMLLLANEQREEIEKKREEVVRKTILLMEKKDELHDYEEKLKQNFIDLEQRKELAEISIKRADEVWQEMTKQVHYINKGLDERLKKTTEREQTLLLQRKFLEEKEMEIEKEKQHIESQQKTLKTAFEELRNKSK